MSLRGQKVEENARPMMTFRCPKELRRYIDETAATFGRDKTEVITDALELDRDLAFKLKPEEGALMAFAKSEGLNVDDDLAEILARLVRVGLMGRKTKR